MRILSSISIASLFGLVCLVACVGDDPSTTTVAGGCDPTQKVCGGLCVSRDDPSLGCGSESCEPCAPSTNADATCVAGACSTTCQANFANCDANLANGCEVNTNSDSANCGACGKACGTAHAQLSTCNGAKCSFTCEKNFGHCGTQDEAGCETDLASDALNCGACGHSCLGGECKSGVCQPFKVASGASPVGVAVDADNVYFSSSSKAYVQRVQHDGKCSPAAPCPQQFIGSPDPFGTYRGVASIVSDGTTLLFMAEAISAVGRRAVTGGDITNWGPASNDGPGNIVIAGGKAYWTNGFANQATVAHVLRSNLDGTNIETVAYYPNPATTYDGKGKITADATYVYWASETTGVYSAPLSATAPCTEGYDGTCKQISGGQAVDIAVDDTFVYWTEPAGSTVHRAQKTGSQPDYVAGDQTGISGIAVMDGYVYWGTTGAIRRAPQVAAPCSGAACEHVADVEAPVALVTAADGLYWTNGVSDGGVFRLAR